MEVWKYIKRKERRQMKEQNQKVEVLFSGLTRKKKEKSNIKLW